MNTNIFIRRFGKPNQHFDAHKAGPWTLLHNRQGGINNIEPHHAELLKKFAPKVDLHKDVATND